MRRAVLSLKELKVVRENSSSIHDGQIMYSVVGLAPGIELVIYRKMNKWWITGDRPGHGPFWLGGHASTKDALAVIEDYFSNHPHRTAE